MGTTVICDTPHCKYNQGGKFCTLDFLPVYGGICGKIVNKRGERRPPEEWVRTEREPKNTP